MQALTTSQTSSHGFRNRWGILRTLLILTLTSTVRPYKWHLGTLASGIFRPLPARSGVVRGGVLHRGRHPHLGQALGGRVASRRCHEHGRHRGRGPRRGLGGTSGRNPLACKATLAVLRVIDEEGLLAKAVGRRVREENIIERLDPERVIDLPIMTV